MSQNPIRLQEDIPVSDEILKQQDKEHPTTKGTHNSPVHLFKAVGCEVEALYFGVTCFEGTIKRAERVKTTFSFKYLVYKYTRLSCSMILQHVTGFTGICHLQSEFCCLNLSMDSPQSHLICICEPHTLQKFQKHFNDVEI